MFREPGVTCEAGDITNGDDQVVVRQVIGLGSNASAHAHGAVYQVNRLDFSGVQVSLRTEPTDWYDGVDDTDAAGNHFRKHGLKHHIIFFADQTNLDTTVTFQELLECHRHVNPSEATTYDQNLRRRLLHGSFLGWAFSP